jgi:hypothetical protein
MENDENLDVPKKTLLFSIEKDFKTFLPFQNLFVIKSRYSCWLWAFSPCLNYAKTGKIRCFQSYIIFVISRSSYKYRGFESWNENLHPGNEILANQRALFASFNLSLDFYNLYDYGFEVSGKTLLTTLWENKCIPNIPYSLISL